MTHDLGFPKNSSSNKTNCASIRLGPAFQKKSFSNKKIPTWHSATTATAHSAG